MLVFSCFFLNLLLLFILLIYLFYIFIQLLFGISCWKRVFQHIQQKIDFKWKMQICQNVKRCFNKKKLNKEILYIFPERPKENLETISLLTIFSWVPLKWLHFITFKNRVKKYIYSTHVHCLIFIRGQVLMPLFYLYKKIYFLCIWKIQLV